MIAASTSTSWSLMRWATPTSCYFCVSAIALTGSDSTLSISGWRSAATDVRAPLMPGSTVEVARRASRSPSKLATSFFSAVAAAPSAAAFATAPFRSRSAFCLRVDATFSVCV